MVKSIGCLTYQCSEGDVPDERLFKALREYERALNGLIVADMDEYDAAAWN